MNIPSVQLWLGSQSALEDKIYTYAQKLFCKHKGCGICSICRGIREDRYASVRFIRPEKQYTLAHIEEIHQTLRFKADGIFLFVLVHADMLSLHTANSLLKSLEEPHAGYHFILLAQREEALLPTVKSRCVITVVDRIVEDETSLFFSYFCSPGVSVITFSKELDRVPNLEQETPRLLDALMVHFSKKYTDALCDNSYADDGMALCLAYSEKLPLPGSAKLFWRTLFMQLKKR